MYKLGQCSQQAKSDIFKNQTNIQELNEQKEMLPVSDQDDCLEGEGGKKEKSTILAVAH